MVFLVVLVAFKVAGLAVHQKVDVFYKYKAGDLRLALFNRLNARLGLCLGLVNGLAYLVLISFVIYAFSYWTVQMASSEEDPRGVRLLNRMGRDLQATGLLRAARAIDPFPDVVYEVANVVGDIYRNPLLEGRLSRYPGFIPLSLTPEFHELGQDSEFTNLRVSQGTTIKELLNYPKVQAITQIKGECQQTWEDLASHHAGLLAGVLVDDPARTSGDNALVNEVQRYHELLGDRCYLLAELFGGPDDASRLSAFNELSRATGVPLVAAGDVHYHSPSRLPLHDVLTAIRHGVTVAQAGGLLFPNAQRHLKSPDELRELFVRIPDALQRTRQIADRSTFSLDELRYEYPQELAPPGLTPLEYLKRLTWQGAQQRYPEGVPEKVLQLLKHELQLIEESTSR